MIVYFDTSAFVPLLVGEPTSGLCAQLWDDADDVVTARIMYAEAGAALARARRICRISPQELRSARERMDELWRETGKVEVSQALVEQAADLADLHGLRGYDAVHAAAASLMQSADLVLASGDSDLLQACAALRIATVDTNAPA